MINISEDFSKYPSGRYRADGPNSGERFREELLKPMLGQYDILEIWLDGVKGYPSSFTEEAFGGLVRSGFDKNELLGRRIVVKFDSDAYEGYAQDIYHFIKEARPSDG